MEEETSQPVPTTSKRKAEWFEIDEDRNTYAYVSGLPTTMTEEEFVDLMTKYGIIAKKALPGQPYNVKLYKDKDGSFKGDALCCYVRKEAVDQAVMLLDGYRYDDQHIVNCERAKFEMKGLYDPSKKPRVPDKKAKLKLKKKVNKVLSWDEKDSPEVKQKKVILKYMFTPEEILEDVTLIVDLKDDVEYKCTEIACTPKKIEVCDDHPEGVITVLFAEAEHAERCIKALDNQYYAGRIVKAELWDGKTRYKNKDTVPKDPV